MSLFDTSFPEPGPDKKRPLAERMRPERLEDFVGQEHILAPGKPLRAQIDRDELSSLIFWGPPGVGKTTLARLIARLTRADFVPFSAVLSGIKEIKEVMAAAERNRRFGRRTVVFVDEIHRFNKAQQDAFLPVCGTWRYYPDRRYNGKSLLRSDLRTIVKGEGLLAASADTGGDPRTVAAGARRR